jgi:hypothetical protein
MAIFKSMLGRETKILVEMLERTIVRPLPGAIPGFCRECGEEAIFLIADEAASRSRLPVREIYRRVEQAAVHFLESTDGSALICVNSLATRECPRPLIETREE